VRLRLAFPGALSACALAAGLVAVAGLADGAGIAWVELGATGRDVVVVVDLVGVADAVRAADLAAVVVSLEDFDA